jgi:hypothetical protein
MAMAGAKIPALLNDSNNWVQHPSISLDREPPRVVGGIEAGR